MKKLAPILIILGLALGIRVAAVFDMQKFPVFSHPQLDEMEYYNWAKDIVDGHVLWTNIPIHSPGYAFFLALNIKLFDNPYLSARLMQSLISAISVFFIFGLGRRFFNERAGLISAALAAFFWPFVYFQTRLLPGDFNIFFLLLALLLILSAEKRAELAGFFSGLSLGLSALFWPMSLALAPAALVYFRALRGLKKSMPPALLFILGILIPIAPITIQNYRAEKEFILFQKNFGLNFYLGNGPNADGTPYLRPGGGWDALQAMPVRQSGIERSSEQDRFYLKQWGAWAARHPGAWLNLLVRKTKLLLDNREIIASFDPNFYRVRMLSVKACPINSALVIALALLGLFSAPARKEKFLLLGLGIFFLGLALVLNLIASRYRLGFMALMLIASGAGANEIYEMVKAKNELRFWALTVSMLIIFTLSMIPIPKTLDQSGYEFVHLGQAYKDADELDKAEQSFMGAVNYPGSCAGGWYGLAQVRMRQMKLDEATEDIDKSIKLDPGYAQAHIAKGAILLLQNRADLAELEFQDAVNLRPQFIYAWAGLADALVREGRIVQAQQAIAKLESLRPDMPDALLLKAKIQMSLGNKDEVLRLLKSYLKVRPQDPVINDLVREMEKQ